MQKLRLFWAVNLPADLKSRLFGIVSRLKAAGADAKWVEEGNLHVTVKFLGEADPALIPRITEAVKGSLIGFDKFRLDMKEMGFFPGVARPRVLWAGFGGEITALKNTARAVDDSMGDLGFPREGRVFTPHITLARIKSPLNIGDLTRAVAMESPGINKMGGFDVCSIDLMSSMLTRSGPVYSLISSVKLGE
ncbi:MAG: RNA 2',3'-cyclic phosphodiesterase [Bacillota bacterium]